MASKYKYLIRPDGSIRLCSQSPLTPGESDTPFESDIRYAPGDYAWDFETKKMVEIPEATKQRQRSAVAAARSSEEAQAGKDLRDLKKKLKRQTVEFREMFVLLARIVGVDLSD
jgi:hypothetical protein